MATAKLRSSRSGNRLGRRNRGRRLLRLLAMGALLVGAVIYFYRVPIDGYLSAGTAYGARIGCSCHYVAGRPMGDCSGDLSEPGLGMVMLSADDEKKSVTAHVPLLASQTAYYRKGWGCVLEPWGE